MIAKVTQEEKKQALDFCRNCCFKYVLKLIFNAEDIQEYYEMSLEESQASESSSSERNQSWDSHLQSNNNAIELVSRFVLCNVVVINFCKCGSFIKFTLTQEILWWLKFF